MNKIRPKFIIFLIVLFPFFNSCNNRNTFKVVSIVNISENFSKTSALEFRKAYSLSIMASHYNSIELDNYLYEVALNSNNDTILVFNSTLKNIKKIPLSNIPLYPIEHLYFHNLDSIFLFFNREFIFKTSNENNLKENFDFILINSEGTIINTYDLDSVPNIYKGQLNPMIFQSPGIINENRIFNQDLLIPFSVYFPLTSDSLYSNFHPQFLCKYNLKTKKYKMVSFRFPKNDIGKNYLKNVYTNYISFHQNHRGNIYYSFPYSSSIYEYNYKDDKMVMEKHFPPCHFDNIGVYNSIDLEEINIASNFHPPIYCKSNNLYLRTVEVSEYKDIKRFTIVQILDTNLNILGYSFSDSIYGNISIYHDSVCRYNKSNHKNYFVQLGNYEEIDLQKIETQFLSKKTINNSLKKNDIISKKDFNSRMIDYMNLLKLPKNSKIITIYTDETCSTCLDYLMKSYLKNEGIYKQNKIYYLFIGSDPSIASSIMNNYKIHNTLNIIIDNKFQYKNFMFKEELPYYYLIKYDSINFIKIFKCQFDNLIPNYDYFIKNS
ncbi:MAG: DUF4221 domain-containing protein [Saprospiraceae bacterium]|nr:DUF4221 domain-containing protein [Saprospiraceae bacterium]